MYKKKHASVRRDLVFLALSVFIVSTAWIGFNLYHAAVTTTVTPDLQKDIIPIDPHFDTVTLSQLKNRRIIQAQDTLSNVAVPSPSIAPTTVPVKQVQPTILPQLTTVTSAPSVTPINQP